MARFDLSTLRTGVTALVGATLLSITCLAGALAPARAAETAVEEVGCGPIAADRIA